tara:strand:- start:313 stop:1980 length:1668 start_codon:yes stop_codon:yes gene_type:complete
MKVLFYYRGSEHFGVQALIAYLESKGHETELVYDPALGDNGYLDIPFVNNLLNNLVCNDKLVVEKVLRFKPDLIAFSAITNLYLPITRLARKIKKVLDVPIVIGGIHPTSIPEEVIKDECYDAVCIGEGEEPLAELLERIEQKRSFTDVKNLWVKDKSGKIHKNPKRKIIKSLDDLPTADKSLFEKYGALTTQLNIMTTRGCPYECTFCVNSFRNSLYTGEVYLRQRSAKNVIAGITELQKTYKFKSVRFHDDVFAFNVKWLREFKEEYVKHVNLPFHCYVTPSTAKEEIIRLLAEAGCTKISIGVQSGCEAIRTKLLNRKHTDDDIVEAAHRIRKHGIKLSAEFIFGFPEETPEDMWKSLNLSDRLNANYSPSFVFYPYPKTELAEYCLEKGYLNKKNYELVKKGHGSYHTTGWLDLPYMDDVYKFAKILPIYTVCPKFLRPLLRKIIKMKYGFIHKFLAVLAIPAIDPQEFVKRVKEMPRMFFATRKALRVDDWKKKPKKTVNSEKTVVETFADKAKITPKPLVKDPLTSESKEIAEPWRNKINRNRPIKDSA